MPNKVFNKNSVDAIKNEIAAGDKQEELNHLPTPETTEDLGVDTAPVQTQTKNDFLPKVDDITSVPKEVYEQTGAFEPAFQVTLPPGKTKVQTGVQRQGARPAEEFDLSKLTEADIMDMPQIEAADFDTLTFLDKILPKEAHMRFHWVYCGTAAKVDAGPVNVARYQNWKFDFASLEDVQDEGLDFARALLNDKGRIQYYDIVLMKVDVFRLMSLYKRNILKGTKRMENIKKNSERMAEESFRELVGVDPRAAAAIKSREEYKVSFS